MPLRSPNLRDRRGSHGHLRYSRIANRSAAGTAVLANADFAITGGEIGGGAVASFCGCTLLFLADIEPAESREGDRRRLPLFM